MGKHRSGEGGTEDTIPGDAGWLQLGLALQQDETCGVHHQPSDALRHLWHFGVEGETSRWAATGSSNSNCVCLLPFPSPCASRNVTAFTQCNASLNYSLHLSANIFSPKPSKIRVCIPFNGTLESNKYEISCLCI